MPRNSRKNQIQDSLTYHIYNRGNAKLDVFHEDDDFTNFIYRVSKYKKKYDLEIFHWSLMDNHFHMSCSIKKPEQLSKCMGAIQQSYVQYHHKKWKSAGKLWQGRFVSQPVQKEKYLYECGRYIERNPMKAGIVKYPWEYKWSSCRFYVNNKPDLLTTPNPEYESFGGNDRDKVEAYKEWLMEGEDKGFEKMDMPVGDDDFVRKLIKLSGRVVGRRRGRPPSVRN